MIPVTKAASIVLSADGVATAKPGHCYGFILSGTAGVCKFYDHASAASGTEFAEASALGMYVFPVPVQVLNGIYVDLTSAVVTVLYT